jgi:hypothetical protein
MRRVLAGWAAAPAYAVVARPRTTGCLVSRKPPQCRPLPQSPRLYPIFNIARQTRIFGRHIPLRLSILLPEELYAYKMLMEPEYPS